jgi:hypothetical protein
VDEFSWPWCQRFHSSTHVPTRKHRSNNALGGGAWVLRRGALYEALIDWSMSTGRMRATIRSGDSP